MSEETEPGIIQVHQDTLQSLQSLIHAKQQMATEEILKVKVEFAKISHTASVLDMQ